MKLLKIKVLWSTIGCFLLLDGTSALPHARKRQDTTAPTVRMTSVSAWAPMGLNYSGRTFGLYGTTGGPNTTLANFVTATVTLLNPLGVPTATVNQTITDIALLAPSALVDVELANGYEDVLACTAISSGQGGCLEEILYLNTSLTTTTVVSTILHTVFLVNATTVVINYTYPIASASVAPVSGLTINLATPTFPAQPTASIQGGNGDTPAQITTTTPSGTGNGGSKPSYSSRTTTITIPGTTITTLVPTIVTGPPYINPTISVISGLVSTRTITVPGSSSIQRVLTTLPPSTTSFISTIPGSTSTSYVTIVTTLPPSTVISTIVLPISTLPSGSGAGSGSSSVSGAGSGSGGQSSNGRPCIFPCQTNYDCPVIDPLLGIYQQCIKPVSGCHYCA